MTRYEWFRWFTFPLMPVHLNVVRKDLNKLLASYKGKESFPSILDVGGRKSPYTIGIPASITLLDVPQESSVQEALHLGFTQDILSSIKVQRSNIKDLIVEDMTQSTLLDNSYDAVVCVEVIEHVHADEPFVKNIARVVKPGGWVYFTTPNGDYIKNEGPNKNPDHVRHYTKQGLESLLGKYFDEVEVHYAVATGKYRVMGLRSFKANQPIRLIFTIVGNLINRFQSLNVASRPNNTAHLIAKAFIK